MQEQMEIFEYIDTFNLQDPDKLESREQALFEDWDNQDKSSKPVHTYNVDEDNLARFIELVSMLDAGRKWFKNNSNCIIQIQKRLDAAKAGAYMPHNEFTAHVKAIINCKSKASDFSVRYQAAKKEMKQLLAKEGKALWARWYQIKDHDAYLADYLNKPINQYFTWGGNNETFDSECIDSRYSTNDEVFGDTHVQEMAEYNKPAQENSYLGCFWNLRNKYICENF